MTFSLGRRRRRRSRGPHFFFFLFWIFTPLAPWHLFPRHHSVYSNFLPFFLCPCLLVFFSIFFSTLLFFISNIYFFDLGLMSFFVDAPPHVLCQLRVFMIESEGLVDASNHFFFFFYFVPTKNGVLLLLLFLDWRPFGFSSIIFVVDCVVTSSRPIESDERIKVSSYYIERPLLSFCFKCHKCLRLSGRDQYDITRRAFMHGRSSSEQHTSP